MSGEDVEKMHLGGVLLCTRNAWFTARDSAPKNPRPRNPEGRAGLAFVNDHHFGGTCEGISLRASAPSDHGGSAHAEDSRSALVSARGENAINRCPNIHKDLRVGSAPDFLSHWCRCYLPRPGVLLQFLLRC